MKCSKVMTEQSSARRSQVLGYRLKYFSHTSRHTSLEKSQRRNRCWKREEKNVSENTDWTISQNWQSLNYTLPQLVRLAEDRSAYLKVCLWNCPRSPNEYSTLTGQDLTFNDVACVEWPSNVIKLRRFAGKPEKSRTSNTLTRTALSAYLPGTC